MKINSPELDKVEQKILRSVGKAIGDFELIAQDDRILVAVSGGKDSWVLLHALDLMKKRAPIDFELIAVNVDQGFRGFRQDLIEDYLESRKFVFRLVDFNIAKLMGEKMDPAKTPCSFCSRLRRGVLYGMANELGCNKIALGHHLDDLIETLLLNSFFNGRLASMAPKLKSKDGRHIVIRPLSYVSEHEIIQYARIVNFPIVCCQCPLACGASDLMDSKRRMVKRLIDDLQKSVPQVRNSLLKSLKNVTSSHLLDRNLWNFGALTAQADRPDIALEFNF